MGVLLAEAGKMGTDLIVQLQQIAGMLTVTDTPRVLDAVGHYINGRNMELNRQVVLNVKYSPSKNDARISWVLTGMPYSPLAASVDH